MFPDNPIPFLNIKWQMKYLTSTLMFEIIFTNNKLTNGIKRTI